MSSETDMSTTERHDSSTPPDDDEPSLTDLAQAVSNQTDDGHVEQLATVVQKLAGGQADVESKLGYWKQRVETAEADHAELEERVTDLEQAHADLDQQLDSLIGPVGEMSSREKRLKDIRAMMVSVARGTGRPAKWSRGDIKEQLLGKGYDEDDLPKDTMFNSDIHELADTEPGFGKEKRMTETPDGAHREVWHLVVDPDALPGAGEVEAASSSTTGPGGQQTTSKTES